MYQQDYCTPREHCQGRCQHGKQQDGAVKFRRPQQPMLIPHLVLVIPMILLVLIHDSHGWTTTTTTTAHHRRRRRPTAFLPITDGRSFQPCCCCTTTTLYVTTPPNTDKEEEEEEEESVLTDVDTRVLRAMLQEEKFINPNDTEELRKLLERGTVKTTPTTSRRNNNNSNNNNDNDDDEASVYSSQVLKTLTDTKLWKKLSVQAGDILESVSIWVSNKVEQDVKVLAALSIFAWDRVQQDVARALPASSSASGILPKPLLLLTNASAYQESTTSPENLRDQMNRPQDELKSVSRELFAILSGERTNYQQQKMQQQQRGLRTVAPAGTVYSGERQRRALQQKRKVEQSKQNVATNIGSNVVDRVWELRQEIKSETNVPGYKTKPLRQAISARTQNLLESVREKAQLVAAATIRQEQPSENELRLSSSSSSSSSILSATEEMPVEPTNVNVETATTTRTDDNDDVGTIAVLLLRDIYTERERIMNQLTTAIHRPTESWLTVDVVDTLDSMEVISSPGMQHSLTKMILLRDEIQKNHFDWDETTAMSQNPSASSLDAAVNDLLAIRTAIEYLYNTTVQDVSELVAEEMRYFILFGASTSDTNHNSSNNQKNIENDVPLILRIEEEVLRIEQQQQQQENIDEFVAVSVMPTDVDPIRNTATLPRPSVAVVADAVLVNVEEGEPSTWIANDRKVASTILDDDHDDDDSIASNVAEIVSEDDFDNAVGPATFKQVYNVNEDEQASDVESSPNLLLVLVLRSLDVLLFVTEQVVTVGAPGTIKVVTNVMTRLDEMNRLGLGTKGWKEFGNAAKAKGRY